MKLYLAALALSLASLATLVFGGKQQGGEDPPPFILECDSSHTELFCHNSLSGGGLGDTPSEAIDAALFSFSAGLQIHSNVHCAICDGWTELGCEATPTNTTGTFELVHLEQEEQPNGEWKWRAQFRVTGCWYQTCSPCDV